MRNAHYTLLVRVGKAPLQWSDVATLIDPDFRNMHKRDTPTLVQPVSRSGECSGAVTSELFTDRKFEGLDRAVGARWSLRWLLPYIWEFLEMGKPRMISKWSNIHHFVVCHDFYGETGVLDQDSSRIRAARKKTPGDASDT